MKDAPPPQPPDIGLRNLDPETVKRIVLAAADVAIVVDAEGVVRDCAFRSDDLRDEIGDSRRWLGRRWRSAVTVESRPKLDALLNDAVSERPIRWRHLNHPARAGADDVAISYSAVKLADENSVIVLGRDLRSASVLQQRLVETQQALEHDYATLRETETRYRMLFETAQDAVAIVDAGSLKAVELNPAARQLLGRDARRGGSRPFIESFDPAARALLSEALATARSTGHSESVTASLGAVSVQVSISALREESGLFLLVRMTPQRSGQPALAAEAGHGTMPALLERMPDGVVLTDIDGDVLSVNAAFRLLVGLTMTQSVAGEALGRWVGQEGVDLGVLIANLRQRGAVKAFSTTLRGETGGSTAIEISASTAGEPQAGYAFFIRDISRRMPGDSRLGRGMTQSADRISELIGRVSLKELVRESTDAIERLCIEAALDMTGNNRASAAEMLGLSRQSLYVKLRRYGLGDLGDEVQQ